MSFARFWGGWRWGRWELTQGRAGLMWCILRRERLLLTFYYWRCVFPFLEPALCGKLTLTSQGMGIHCIPARANGLVFDSDSVHEAFDSIFSETV